MKQVNTHLAVKARQVPPNDNGYLFLAAEVGRWRGPFPTGRRNRRALLGRLAAMAPRLAAHPSVVECTLFRAAFRPPGEGLEVLRERHQRPARYDVVMLIRTVDIDSARRLRKEADYHALFTEVEAASRRTHQVVARNAARLGDVDHRPNHPFLFNYFSADDIQTLLGVWEYTAGWFQAKTNLPNSTLMQPIDGESTAYGFINHASWPKLRTFIPSQILRPTFRSFVLANFRANNIAAQPIIYRRVWSSVPRCGPTLGGWVHRRGRSTRQIS